RSQPGDRRAVERHLGRSSASDATSRRGGVAIDHVRDSSGRGEHGTGVGREPARGRGVEADAARALAAAARAVCGALGTVAGQWEDIVISSFSRILESLTRQRGVRASLIVSESDGLIVDSNLRFGQDGDRVAALAASMYRKARLSAAAARLGSVTFLELDAERGRICAAGGRGDLVLVVVADPSANVGLIRVELLRALESLE